MNLKGPLLSPRSLTCRWWFNRSKFRRERKKIRWMISSVSLRMNARKWNFSMKVQWLKYRRSRAWYRDLGRAPIRYRMIRSISSQSKYRPSQRKSKIEKILYLKWLSSSKWDSKSQWLRWALRYLVFSSSIMIRQWGSKQSTRHWNSNLPCHSRNVSNCRSYKCLSQHLFKREIRRWESWSKI